jgi:transcriptional regulator with XRE-family HTH domain
MPTIEQIRAARALLDWSQADLASYADLSQTGIARIENGTNQPNTQTLEKIKRAFGGANIEFIDGGVRLAQDKLTIIKGKDCLRKLQDDIFHTLSKRKDDIRILGIDEISPDEGEDYSYTKMHIQRLIDAGINERILIQKGKTDFLAPKEWYRSIPEKYFSPHTVFIYDSKIALVLRAPEYKVLLLDNPFFAASLKTFFDFLWDNAER